MNSPAKQLEILNRINSRKFNFIGVLENKLTASSIQQFMRKVPSNWCSTNNISTSDKSRIIIMWDTTFWSTNVLYSADQYMSCLLTSQSGLTILCTVVYAHNAGDDRKELWSFLMQQATIVNLPWIILGDFNEILSTNE